MQDGANRPVRVWADGCFDFFHIGHANALRQAAAMGDVLVVGVHSDADILRNKGPTIMNEQERYAQVRACRWVDEIVEGAPYTIDIDVLDQHRIDFVVHGEDITTDVDGNDVYACVKGSGRYKEIHRTDGISTTDVLERMLIMTTDGTMPAQPKPELNPSALTRRLIEQFSENCKLSPSPSDRVVYIDGRFDCFHSGHSFALKMSRDLGTYLIVGIHEDDQGRDRQPCVLGTDERVLSVLACRYTDQVVIGAPRLITDEFLKSLNIAVVTCGERDVAESNLSERYAVPILQRKFYRVQSPFPSLSTATLLKRIQHNRVLYERRNEIKLGKISSDPNLQGPIAK